MKFKPLIGLLTLSSVLASNCVFSWALPLNINLNSTNIESSPISFIARQKIIVVVDAGHGGSDPGAVYGGVNEKHLNLDMALKLGKLLEQKGLKVLYTRKTDVFVSLKQRAVLANNAKAALFISIHNNALPYNLSYRGTETLFALPTAGKSYPFKINSQALASIIQNELVSSLKTTNHGLKYRPNLSVLKRTLMPAVITEISYMTNKGDLASLNNNNFRQNAANAISIGVIKALKKMGKL